MSENGEIYTAGNKFYTPAGTDGMDKFHLCCPPCEFHLVTRTVLPKVEKQIALADHHHDHEERDSG